MLCGMPMRTSYTHFKYYPELVEALIRHCDGRAPADTTIVRPGWPAFIPVGDQNQHFENLRYLRRFLKKGRPGRPGTQHVDACIGGPPPFDAPDAWPRPKLELWAWEIVREFIYGFGYKIAARPGSLHNSRHLSLFIYAYLHCGETSPHLQMGFAPFHRRTKDNSDSLAWGVVQANLAAHFNGGRPVKGGGPAHLRVIGRGVARIGQKYGLGIATASGRKHQPPDRVKGLMTRISLLQDRGVEKDREIADL